MISIWKSFKLKNGIPDISLPLVYGWKRGHEWLYIGKCYNGTQRIKTHNLIGKSVPIEDNDEIYLWRGTDKDLDNLEMELIRRLQPFYNIDHTRHGMKLPRFNEDGKQICYSCEKIIKKPRANKLFCNQKCKNYYWRNRSGRQKMIETIDTFFLVNPELKKIAEETKKMLDGKLTFNKNN